MNYFLHETLCGQNQYLFSKCISNGYASRNIGHNQSKICEHVYFCPSNQVGIHGKLNKLKFCCKQYRICHLWRLGAIIIDVLLCILCISNRNKYLSSIFCYKFVLSTYSPFIPVVFQLEQIYFKASLTFKCLTEHRFADLSYSIPLDTYL